MQIPFENMPNTARIWVYQTDRVLSETEFETVQIALNEQINNWAAHGAPLAGAFKILYNRFVVIAVNEAYNGTSGCSIDASTGWLKELGQQLNINFFDRSIAYLSENEIKSVDFLVVKKAVLEGEILPTTIIFNNLVNTLADFLQSWKIQAKDSWLKKYFISVPA